MLVRNGLVMPENSLMKLVKAFRDGQLVTVTCPDRATEEPVTVLCISYKDDKGVDTLHPVAKLFKDNWHANMEVGPPQDYSVVQNS